MTTPAKMASDLLAHLVEEERRNAADQEEISKRHSAVYAILSSVDPLRTPDPDAPGQNSFPDEFDEVWRLAWFEHNRLEKLIKRLINEGTAIRRLRKELNKLNVEATP